MQTTCTWWGPTIEDWELAAWVLTREAGNLEGESRLWWAEGIDALYQDTVSRQGNRILWLTAYTAFFNPDTDPGGQFEQGDINLLLTPPKPENVVLMQNLIARSNTSWENNVGGVTKSWMLEEVKFPGVRDPSWGEEFNIAPNQAALDNAQANYESISGALDIHLYTQAFDAPSVCQPDRSVEIYPACTSRIYFGNLSQMQASGVLL